ncbi:MAG: sensor histidine kinase N-terminal domain-containing protein, partial [Pseudomonadota bacterium]|nr:sensor histidine kinase N-terminal domain-containing protein [Pseudomonadota bacterium]
MIQFKSIISRIVFLHVIAVVITSILMSLALSWLLNVAITNIHNTAMEEQAASVARHLTAKADGSISLELPPDLQGLYSQPYGRYSYAVLDDRGNTLFSTLNDHTPIFPADPGAGAVQFLKTRKGDALISGASIRREVGTRTVWVQAAEDLANRDVLIDEIVADFFGKVGWITLPILLV